MSLKSTVVSGIRWTSLGAFLTTALLFLQNVILAHLLNPADFGQMAMVMLCIGFLFPAFDFGLSAAVIQAKEVKEIQLSTLYWTNISLGIFCFLLLFIFAPAIAVFFESEDLKLFLQIASINFLLVAWGTLYAALISRALLFDLQNKIAIAGAAMSFIVAVILAIQGFGVWALIFAFLAQNATTSLLNILLGFRLFRPRFQYEFASISSLLRFGSFYAGNNIVNFSSANLDKLLIGKFLGPEALGLYTLAWNLVLMPVRKINPILNNVTFPVFSKIQEDRKTLSAYYSQMIKGLMIVTMPLLLILAMLSEDFLLFLYGEKWTSAALTLSILAFVGLLKSFANPGGALFLAKGYSNIIFYWNLLWTIVLFSALWLVLNYQASITSIAIAHLALGLTLGWLWHWMIVKHIGIAYKTLLGKMALLLLFGLPLFGLYFLFDYFIVGGGLYLFAAKIIVGLLLYMAYLLLFFRKELSNFKSLLK